MPSSMTTVPQPTFFPKIHEVSSVSSFRTKTEIELVFPTNKMSVTPLKGVAFKATFEVLRTSVSVVS